MKPFVFDATLTDPLDVARRDNMEYFIDKILEHECISGADYVAN